MAEKCPTCGGRGELPITMRPTDEWGKGALPCDRCKGSGELEVWSCPNCDGGEIVVRIPMEFTMDCFGSHYDEILSEQFWTYRCKACQMTIEENEVPEHYHFGLKEFLDTANDVLDLRSEEGW